MAIPSFCRKRNRGSVRLKDVSKVPQIIIMGLALKLGSWTLKEEFISLYHKLSLALKPYQLIRYRVPRENILINRDQC